MAALMKKAEDGASAPASVPSAPAETIAGSSKKLPPLNLKTLIDAGAVRVTYPGNGKDGGFVRSEKKDYYAVVSKENDGDTDSYTRKWPDKPKSVEAAVRDAKDPKYFNQDKHDQIVRSAKSLGLSDSDIFLYARR